MDDAGRNVDKQGYARPILFMFNEGNVFKLCVHVCVLNSIRKGLGRHNQCVEEPLPLMILVLLV